jgi:hypothetical protein
LLKDKIREQRDRINAITQEKDAISRIIIAKEEQIRTMQEDFKLQTHQRVHELEAYYQQRLHDQQAHHA